MADYSSLENTIREVTKVKSSQMAKIMSKASNDDSGVTEGPVNVVHPTIQSFAKKHIKSRDGSTLHHTHAYEKYTDHCDNINKDPVSLQDFTHGMREMGYNHQRIAGQNRYVGITLKEDLSEKTIKDNDDVDVLDNVDQTIIRRDYKHSDQIHNIKKNVDAKGYATKQDAHRVDNVKNRAEKLAAEVKTGATDNLDKIAKEIKSKVKTADTEIAKTDKEAEAMIKKAYAKPVHRDPKKPLDKDHHKIKSNTKAKFQRFRDVGEMTDPIKSIPKSLIDTVKQLHSSGALDIIEAEKEKKAKKKSADNHPYLNTDPQEHEVKEEGGAGEIGTKELLKKYKKDTPGEDENDLFVKEENLTEEEINESLKKAAKTIASKTGKNFKHIHYALRQVAGDVGAGLAIHAGAIATGAAMGGKSGAMIGAVGGLAASGSAINHAVKHFGMHYRASKRGLALGEAIEEARGTRVKLKPGMSKKEYAAAKKAALETSAKVKQKKEKKAAEPEVPAEPRRKVDSNYWRGVASDVARSVQASKSIPAGIKPQVKAHATKLINKGLPPEVLKGHENTLTSRIVKHAHQSYVSKTKRKEPSLPKFKFMSNEETGKTKWNYPKEITKTRDMYDGTTTNAAENRKKRKEFRKKIKGKAHAALKKGLK